MHKFTVHRNSKLPKEPDSISMRRKKQWISYIAELRILQEFFEFVFTR